MYVPSAWTTAPIPFCFLAVIVRVPIVCLTGVVSPFARVCQVRYGSGSVA